MDHGGETMEELKNWISEKRSAYLYRILSKVESGTPRQTLFQELAKAADDQAEFWAKGIRKSGGQVPEEYRPDMRARIVGHLLTWVGPRAIRTVLAAMKVRGLSVYSGGEPGHPKPTNLADVGRRHKGFGGQGNLRAAVFGVNDGLVSNASLIMGVAGASSNNAIILLSGVAGLLAGAFSMAAGEYLSVRSQREMFEYQIGLERDELEEYPQEEAAELALIFEAKGLKPDQAKQLAGTLISDPDRALDMLAREELGLNPDELGSPWGAALFSFSSFTIGAAIPLFPFVFGGLVHNLMISMVLTGIALFAVGATLSLFTGRHSVLGGLRMLLIGGAAGGITYLIGTVLGINFT
jgi:VIT1/CCC1 family predicted Fe2+/Mn2+ transporter